MLDRLVAIKVPVTKRAAELIDVKTYRDEARILSQLSHPNIVPVYDVGETSDCPFFVVSKYIDGGDLSARLALGRPAFAESAELVAVVCDALHYTHTQDLFHRDIKPANILINSAGVPYLADFGLALKDENFGTGAAFVGTVAYSSPEQARGEGHLVDGRSDIFSLGIVFYEMLTCRRPFRGDSHEKVLEQIIGSEPRPPRQIDDTIPRELERICLKALSKRAAERYATALDMAEDLRHFLKTASDDDAVPALTSAPTQSFASTPADAALTTTWARSDIGGGPLRIIPKGLGSFDEHDADFFLGLLPGPRDREGLPDGLRFWKTRIEATDPDKTFRMGMIYGPSGSGKSSLVKAGLLPLLGKHVTSVYLEATSGETEARLLRGIKKAVRELPAHAGLVDSFAGSPARPLSPSGPQVARGARPVRAMAFRTSPRSRRRAGRRAAAVRRRTHPGALPGARRLLDGGDPVFEGPRNRPGSRPQRRRGRPLRAKTCPQGFGRVWSRVRCSAPGRRRSRRRNNTRFSTRPSPGWPRTDGRAGTAGPLCRNGQGQALDACHAPRQSAAWTGSASSFSKRHSARHGLRRASVSLNAAQAVLKSLLPETNTDIKGRMRSIEELRDVSGYAERPTEISTT